MSKFSDFYSLFLQTRNAREIFAQIKAAQPDLSDSQIAASAQSMAKAAYILKDKNYFSSETDEGMVSRHWNGIFRSLLKQPPQITATAQKLAPKFSREIMPLCRNEREEALARSAFSRIAFCSSVYKTSVCSDEDFQKKLFGCFCKILLSPKLSITEKYALSVDVYSDIYQNNPDAFVYRLEMINEAIGKIDNASKLKYICEEIDASFINEGNICFQTLQGFRKNYIPFVQKTDDYVKIASEHDCDSGEYGTIGYMLKTTTTAWSSAALGEMMCIAREIPTTDMLQRKIIRDAAVILDDGKFIGLRDAIHGETIGINELLDSMSIYYDASVSGNIRKQEKAKNKISRYLKNFKSEEFADEYFNIENYEEMLGEEKNHRAIDLIKTIRIDDKGGKAPLCGIAEIDLSSQRFCVSENSGKLVNNLPLFGNLLKKLNSQISENIKENKIGIDPKIIDLMLWCDRKAVHILESRPDFETQCGDYKTEWFKEMLRFSELISNPDYNDEEFEKYYVRLTTMGPDAYKRIAERQTENLKKSVGLSEQKEKDVLKNWNAVQKILGKKDIASREENIKKIFRERRQYLWSGNLLKETMSIVNNFKEPSTRVGERYYKSVQRRISELPMEDMLVKLFNRCQNQKS